MLCVGGVALAKCVVMGRKLFGELTFPGMSHWYNCAYLVESPVGALSLALVLLAARHVFGMVETHQRRYNGATTVVTAAVRVGVDRAIDDYSV